MYALSRIIAVGRVSFVSRSERKRNPPCPRPVRSTGAGFAQGILASHRSASKAGYASFASRNEANPPYEADRTPTCFLKCMHPDVARRWLPASRIKQRLDPRLRRPPPPELHALVQAERTVVPELDLQRRQPEARPVRRARDVADV